MAKEKQNKLVGNTFEDLKENEMAKTQGAGDTDAETWSAVLSVIQSVATTYEITKGVYTYFKD